MLQLLRLRVREGGRSLLQLPRQTRDGPKINHPKSQESTQRNTNIPALLIKNSWSSHTATCNNTHTHTDHLSYTVQLALCRDTHIFTFTSLEKKKSFIFLLCFFFYFVCNIEKWRNGQNATELGLSVQKTRFKGHGTLLGEMTDEII